MFSPKNKTDYIEISKEIISFLEKEKETIEKNIFNEFQETLKKHNITLEHNQDTFIFKTENIEIEKSKQNFDTAIIAASFGLCLLTLKDTKKIKNVIKFGLKDFRDQYHYEAEKMLRIMIKSALKLPENKRPYGIFLPFIGFIMPKELSKTSFWEKPYYPTNDFIMQLASCFQNIDNFELKNK